MVSFGFRPALRWEGNLAGIALDLRLAVFADHTGRLLVVEMPQVPFVVPERTELLLALSTGILFIIFR